MRRVILPSFLVSLATGLAFAGCRAGERSPTKAAAATTAGAFTARTHASVFFVGHSLVNFEMPKNLEVMAKSLGLEIEWDAQIIDGAPLEVHLAHPERTQSMRVDEALPSGFYDTLIMAEAVPIDDMIDYRGSAENAAELVRLARRHRSDVRIFLDEVWMARDRARGGPFMKRLDWRSFLEEDLPKWERVADEASRRAGAPVAVLPSAQALGHLVDAMRAGELPGLVNEEDLFLDQVHLTPLGNHFIGAVTLAALFQRSPSGASGEVVDRHGAVIVVLPERTREALYRVAWRAVSTYARARTPSVAPPRLEHAAKKEHP